MDNLNNLDRFMTVEQLAFVLQVPYDYVYSLISDGTLAGIELPGNFDDSVRISSDSVQKFIADCSVCDIRREVPEQKVFEEVFSEPKVPEQQIPAQGVSQQVSAAVFDVQKSSPASANQPSKKVYRGVFEV